MNMLDRDFAPKYSDLDIAVTFNRLNAELRNKIIHMGELQLKKKNLERKISKLNNEIINLGEHL